MTTRSKYLIPFAIVLAILAVLAYRLFSGGPGADASRQSAPLVRLELPHRETVTSSLQFTGDVVAIQQAGIFSKVSGNLDRVYVDMGTRVQQGQTLALIDTTELHQQYQQAEATYENARLTFRRTRDLFAQNLVSQQDLDNSEATMKVTAAAFDAAKTRLSYARITAPFAGFVTKRFLDAGALVTPNNSTLFTLMDLDQMKITVNVLEKDIPRIAVGKSATITVDAFPEKEFEGQITRLSEAVDPGTRTMAIEIDIPNRGHTLKPGMFASVTLVVEEHRDAVTVPTVALLKDDQGFYLYAAAGDTARRIRVTPGWEQGERTEIRTGLSDSLTIITTGQQFVRDGGPVKVQR
jgi:membrane fusion protein (multidrug efflux system)